MADAVGGHRRIDRVLAEDYLPDLTELTLDEVRTLRTDAEQEEADLSYLRRMIQGRLDIIEAELERRETGAGRSLVEDLARILSDGPRPEAHGMGRHVAAEASRVGEHRRYVERLIADVELSAVPDRSADELRATMTELATQEAEISTQRRRVQEVADACSAEITRRYRDGEAVVSDLLANGAPS